MWLKPNVPQGTVAAVLGPKGATGVSTTLTKRGTKYSVQGKLDVGAVHSISVRGQYNESSIFPLSYYLDVEHFALRRQGARCKRGIGDCGYRVQEECSISVGCSRRVTCLLFASVCLT